MPRRFAIAAIVLMLIFLGGQAASDRVRFRPPIQRSPIEWEFVSGIKPSLDDERYRDELAIATNVQAYSGLGALGCGIASLMATIRRLARRRPQTDTDDREIDELLRKHFPRGGN